MSNRMIRLAVIGASIFILGLAGPAQAQTVDDVAQTGEFLNAAGTVDLFWSFLTGQWANPGGGLNAFVIPKHPAWVDPGANSLWISENPNGDEDGTEEFTTYFTHFSLTNPAGFSLSGDWSSDNGSLLFLNGILISNIVDDDFAFQTLHPFSIASGFESFNTLYAQVYNLPNGPALNPTGLLVTNLQATVTPEPISLTLLGTGLLGLGAVARRRRREGAEASDV